MVKNRWRGNCETYVWLMCWWNRLHTARRCCSGLQSVKSLTKPMNKHVMCGGELVFFRCQRTTGYLHFISASAREYFQIEVDCMSKFLWIRSFAAPFLLFRRCVSDILMICRPSIFIQSYLIRLFNAVEWIRPNLNCNVRLSAFKRYESSVLTHWGSLCHCVTMTFNPLKPRRWYMCWCCEKPSCWCWALTSFCFRSMDLYRLRRRYVISVVSEGGAILASRIFWAYLKRDAHRGVEWHAHGAAWRQQMWCLSLAGRLHSFI